MIRLLANANYDFIKWRKWAYMLTALLIIPGLVELAIRGLNYSIEFTGGTLLQVETSRIVSTAELRSDLDQAGIHGAEIQTFGADTAFIIRARLGASAVGTTEATAAAVNQALEAKLGSGQFRIVRTEAAEAKVGRELQGKALMAILFSFVVVLIYLAIRFEWRFGLAAVLATAHDILATIAFIRYLNLEVSLVVVGAVLTMVGYSLNDTIIIFDRVRENLRKFRRQNLYEILNLSVNETLPRSILTHGTTHGDDAGPGAARGRGDPAVCPGHDVRDFHRHVLVDLHRGADSDVHRKALAGRGRPRRADVCRGLTTDPAATGARPPDAGPSLQGRRLTCWSTPTVTWGTGRSTEIDRRCCPAPRSRPSAISW